MKQLVGFKLQDSDHFCLAAVVSPHYEHTMPNTGNSETPPGLLGLQVEHTCFSIHLPPPGCPFQVTCPVMQAPPQTHVHAQAPAVLPGPGLKAKLEPPVDAYSYEWTKSIRDHVIATVLRWQNGQGLRTKAFGTITCLMLITLLLRVALQ